MTKKSNNNSAPPTKTHVTLVEIFMAVSVGKHRPNARQVPFIGGDNLAPSGTAFLIAKPKKYSAIRLEMAACSEDAALYALTALRAVSNVRKMLKREASFRPH